MTLFWHYVLNEWKNVVLTSTFKLFLIDRFCPLLLLNFSIICFFFSMIFVNLSFCFSMICFPMIFLYEYFFLWLNLSINLFLYWFCFVYLLFLFHSNNLKERRVNEILTPEVTYSFSCFRDINRTEIKHVKKNRSTSSRFNLIYFVFFLFIIRLMSLILFLSATNLRTKKKEANKKNTPRPSSSFISSFCFSFIVWYVCLVDLI